MQVDRLTALRFSIRSISETKRIWAWLRLGWKDERSDQGGTSAVDETEMGLHMPCQGALLKELGEFERAQDRSLIRAVSFTADSNAVVVQTLTGIKHEISATATRQNLYEALLRDESDVQVPSSSESEFVADPRTTHGVWVELLNDLGSSLQNMVELIPGLRVRSVRREDSLATVTLESGQRSKSFTADLASGREPLGISIDWAFEFRADQDPTQPNQVA